MGADQGGRPLSTEAQARAERRAEQLRANLKRRKDQARARAGGDRHQDAEDSQR